MSTSAMKLACGVEYIGTQYCGWQSQKDHVAIQDHLEKAISRVANESIRIHGSGRTDSGVHAYEQVFHFTSHAKREKNQWIDGINSNLPNDILIRWVKEVPIEFDARRSALFRRYDYLIENNRPSVFLKGRSLFVYKKLNLMSMKKAANHLIGKNDFSSFRASSCQSNNPTREMKSISVVQEDQLRIEFIANAYLHHMIRNIMGTLIDIGHGKIEADMMKEILDAKDRKLASKKVSADGLYLFSVKYPEKYQLPTIGI
jgi:tRNA pseudouridine38-40 synthase